MQPEEEGRQFGSRTSVSRKHRSMAGPAELPALDPQVLMVWDCTGLVILNRDGLKGLNPHEL